MLGINEIEGLASAGETYGQGAFGLVNCLGAAARSCNTVGERPDHARLDI